MLSGRPVLQLSRGKAVILLFSGRLTAIDSDIGDITMLGTDERLLKHGSCFVGCHEVVGIQCLTTR